MYVPYQQIVDQFELKEDDILLISSDITKLTYTSIRNKEKFDPNLFVDSFKDKLTKGTILIPAFIEHFKSGDIFDRSTSIPEMGALSKVVFVKGGYKRSSDPLHSFFVVGKKADEVEAIHSVSTFGSDSVFAFLHQNKAKMLIIDVDLQHSFTFAHYVEESQSVSYRKFSKLKYKSLDKKGGIHEEKLFIYSKKRGVVNTLNNLESLFIGKGAMQVQKINNSTFLLVDLAKAYDLISDDIKRNKGRNLYRFDKVEYIKRTVKAVLGK